MLSKTWTQYFSGGRAPKKCSAFPFFTLGTCFKAIRPEFLNAESRAEKQSLFFHFGISDTWSNPHNFKDDFEKKKKKTNT